MMQCLRACYDFNLGSGHARRCWSIVDALEHNARLMAQRCADAGIDWRPHVKACKSPGDGPATDLTPGAVGVTCAKASEALAMARGRRRRHPARQRGRGRAKGGATRSRWRHLATLCVAVDDAANIREISTAADSAGVTIDLLVDIDVNLHRCGVTPEQAPALCALIADLPAVRLRGLMGYEGHVMGLPDEREATGNRSLGCDPRPCLHDLCRQADGHEIGVLSGRRQRQLPVSCSSRESWASSRPEARRSWT